MIKTAEQIAKLTDDKNGISNIRAINKIYRGQEKKAHIERAIRKVRSFGRYNGTIYGLEYCYALEYELSKIANEDY